ncbi:MAG: hypothetical protein NWF01_05850 [Candidatus Bathyarchaeota archaeon]|nr:hypothetical protein [Candidatus Bathyarchaeota archaeon]
MGNTVCKTVYFEKTGPANTMETFELAKKRAEELGVKNVVVASSSGETGVKASEFLNGFNLVVVTYVTGFSEPNLQQFSPQNRAILESKSAKILTTAHAFGTLGRAVHNKFGTIQADGIISSTLRLFGQGVKVACEISCMAADAGLIRTDETVIAIGGTGHGADTALVLKPTNTHTFFNLAIKEIICKPHL